MFAQRPGERRWRSGFVAVGWIAQTLFLGYRAATATASRCRVRRIGIWSQPGCWWPGICTSRSFIPNLAQGAFILPLVLALIAAAQFAESGTVCAIAGDPDLGSDPWHILAAGGRGGDRRLCFRRDVSAASPAAENKLPAAPDCGCRAWNGWNGSTAGRSSISVLMAGIGTLSGYVLNLVNHRYRQDELPWSDPIVWQSSRDVRLAVGRRAVQRVLSSRRARGGRSPI